MRLTSLNGTLLLDAGGYDAALFDLDGVLTSTARIHAAAWKCVFDEFLAAWDSAHGTANAPFATAEDYPAWVDGKPREDGVRDFLRSRDITLPEGERECAATEWSVRGIGRRKQELVEEALRTEGVSPFPGSIAWVRQLRAAGFATAVVTSSRNAAAVLDAAGITNLFDVLVDGALVEERGLRGKPAPDAFIEAARRLDVVPERAVVIEDARAGVRAARDGSFGLVIGVDRVGDAAALRDAGADLVVADLAELLTAATDATHQAGPRAHRLRAGGERVLAVEGDFPIDECRIVERRFAPEHAPQLESIFALSNGYLGLRGVHEEGSPMYAPAAFLNGFHETWPIVYPEGAYGLAETGQTIVGVPDGSIVRLFVDDECVDLTRVEMLEYERALDMAAGTLDRRVMWRGADGCRFLLRTRRLVSLEHKHLAAAEYEVTALDRPARLTLVSELVLHGDAADLENDDPRRSRDLGAEVLVPTAHNVDAGRVALSLRTRTSGLHMACGMDHHIDAGQPIEPEATVDAGRNGRVVFRVDAEPGRAVRLVKHIGYHYSASASANELLFRVGETLDRAHADGFERIARAQRRRLDEFWSESDVVTEGSPLLQQAVRFSLFQLLQASARVEGHGVPAKGLTGHGYEGQYFWDTEIYVMPFLTYTAPHLARSLLSHRYEMLDAARRRASVVGHAGALFPWRTINGEEASPRYASGTAQYHINADIAYGLGRYVRATADEEWLARFGAELLVETARMWTTLGFFSDRKGGRFVINNVTGPDEYSTVVDNNTYTNLMARENLLQAADTVRALGASDPAALAGLRDRIGLTDDEPARWRRAAELMYVPFDEDAGVHLQDDGFLDREPWDFENTPADHYPLLLHYHPLVIFRHQVIKQADVVLATFLLDDAFTPEEKRRIFEYYDPLTTGDSSLSESIQSIMAAEVGNLRAAEEYLVDAATVDLFDSAGNVRDGIHVASAGGAWLALVFGFGGLRDRGDGPSFRPQLPQRLQRLSFPLLVRGSRLRVDIDAEGVRYTVTDGPGLTIRHYDERIVLAANETVTRPLQSVSDLAA